MACLRYSEKLPIRLASLETDKEAPVAFRHVGDHCSNDRRARGLQVGKGDSVLRHADKSPLELFIQGLEGRSQHLRHRAVVADDIDKEGTAQLVADSFIRL